MRETASHNPGDVALAVLRGELARRPKGGETERQLRAALADVQALQLANAALTATALRPAAPARPLAAGRFDPMRDGAHTI